METTTNGVTPVMNYDASMNSWIWIIIILFAFWNQNGNGNNDVARESSMNAQFMERDIANLNTNVSNAKYDVGTAVLENRYANSLNTANLDKDILLGDANLQKDILLGNQTLAANMASCCCEIKTAIHSEGEETRALINQNRMADLEYQLNQANTAVANAVQTQNILNSLGNYYPRTGVNPYSVYSGCSCNQVI